MFLKPFIPIKPLRLIKWVLKIPMLSYNIHDSLLYHFSPGFTAMWIDKYRCQSVARCSQIQHNDCGARSQTEPHDR